MTTCSCCQKIYARLFAFILCLFVLLFSFASSTQAKNIDFEPEERQQRFGFSGLTLQSKEMMSERWELTQSTVRRIQKINKNPNIVSKRKDRELIISTLCRTKIIHENPEIFSLSKKSNVAMKVHVLPSLICIKKEKINLDPRFHEVWFDEYPPRTVKIKKAYNLYDHNRALRIHDKVAPQTSTLFQKFDECYNAGDAPAVLEAISTLLDSSERRAFMFFLRYINLMVNENIEKRHINKNLALYKALKKLKNKPKCCGCCIP